MAKVYIDMYLVLFIVCFMYWNLEVATEDYSTIWLSEEQIVEICHLQDNKNHNFLLNLFDFLKKWYTWISFPFLNSAFLKEIINNLDIDSVSSNLDFSWIWLHFWIHEYVVHCDSIKEDIAQLLTETYSAYKEINRGGLCVHTPLNFEKALSKLKRHTRMNWLLISWKNTHAFVKQNEYVSALVNEKGSWKLWVLSDYYYYVARSCLLEREHLHDENISAYLLSKFPFIKSIEVSWWYNHVVLDDKELTYRLISEKVQEKRWIRKDKLDDVYAIAKEKLPEFSDLFLEKELSFEEFDEHIKWHAYYNRNWKQKIFDLFSWWHKWINKMFLDWWLFFNIVEYWDIKKFRNGLDFSRFKYGVLSSIYFRDTNRWDDVINIFNNMYSQYESLYSSWLCSSTPKLFEDAILNNWKNRWLLIQWRERSFFMKDREFKTCIVKENGVWNSLWVLSDYYQTICKEGLDNLYKYNKDMIDFLNKYPIIESAEWIDWLRKIVINDNINFGVIEEEWQEDNHISLFKMNEMYDLANKNLPKD